MDKNNGLQEINNAKEAESIEKNNTFLEKIKKYLNDANFLSKSIVTITAIYAAFYFIQNVFYKFFKFQFSRKQSCVPIYSPFR